MRDRKAIAAMVVTGLGGLTAVRRARRYRDDPVRAPGHRRRGPAPTVDEPNAARGRSRRNQPWVRRTHSDSQQRRFRK